MADSPQSRIWEGWGSVFARPLVAVESRFLMLGPCCTLDRRRLGLRMIGRLFALSCVVLATGLFLWWAPTLPIWGLLLPWSMADPPCTTIMLFFLDHAEEDCFGHAYIFHLCDMAKREQLNLKQDGTYTGQAGSPEDFFGWNVVLPFDAQNGAQAAFALKLKSPDLRVVKNPSLSIEHRYTSRSTNPTHADSVRVDFVFCWVCCCCSLFVLVGGRRLIPV